MVQSYNYGGGYIGYVAKNGKKHSFTLAENFARDKSVGTKVTYTNYRCRPQRWLAIRVREYVLCGACQPVSHCQSSIG